MAEFVGQHVRLGSVASLRSELAGQLVEESKIEVHRCVGWTIERPDGRSRMTTGRIDAAREGLHLDLLIALKSVVPVVLDRVRVRDESAVPVCG